jgi:hypothetical protein
MVLSNLWRYVAGTIQLGLRCGGKISLPNLDLKVYADASFADNLLTRTSTGGHIVFLGDCPITWKSKRQELVTLSTTEAEFINLTPAALSLIFIRNLCKDLGYEQPKPLIVFTDSQNARLTALNPLKIARTRHIDVRYKWIIQKVDVGEFEITHVGTRDMVADGLTKALLREKHVRFVRQLNLCTPPAHLNGMV